ncbi:hypothetical protein Bca4012_092617 [Brassica carinata]
MYFCVFYKCFSDLEDFLDDLPVSRLEVVWTSWKSSDKVVWTSRKSSGLPGSRLDFQEVVWTSSKVVWKSSELLKSLLTKSFELPGSRLDFLEVVWTS